VTVEVRFLPEPLTGQKCPERRPEMATLFEYIPHHGGGGWTPSSSNNLYGTEAECLRHFNRDGQCGAVYAPSGRLVVDGRCAPCREAGATLVTDTPFVDPT